VQPCRRSAIVAMLAFPISGQEAKIGKATLERVARMVQQHHHHHADSTGPHAAAQSLNRIAFQATVHCLTGCAIGEVLGMVIGTALGLSNLSTIIIAVLLAFIFGYAMTLVPLVKANIAFGTALGLAFASDTASITLMEIVDNTIMLIIPGAMDAGLASPLFWGSLAFSLIVAGVAAFPLNRWLISRGLGHAVLHQHH